MELRRLAPETIQLDPTNPRLPEELQGAEQSRLLQYLFENASLDELARSYAENGFFEQEPLLVVLEEDQYVAVEGNRRLAALKVFREEPLAREAGLWFDLGESPGSISAADIPTVPVHVVDSREELRKYLGYRHIGGTVTWSAESKARYLADEVDREAQSDSAFSEVARRVGSNTQGVRNAYIAISTLRAARDDMRLPVEPILHRRFGVWTRCMNSPQLRSYIGIGDPRTLPEVRAQLRSLKRAEMEEVIRDLSPQPGRKRPLLADSRDVTVYAQALEHPEARIALREYGDLQLARQILESAALPDRVAGLANALQTMIGQVSRVTDLPAAASLVEEISKLEPLTSALKALVVAKAASATSAS